MLQMYVQRLYVVFNKLCSLCSLDATEMTSLKLATEKEAWKQLKSQLKGHELMEQPATLLCVLMENIQNSLLNEERYLTETGMYTRKKIQNHVGFDPTIYGFQIQRITTVLCNW